MSGRFFIVRDDGSQDGPFEADTLRAMVGSGRVSATSMVAPEDGGEPFPASTLVEGEGSEPQPGTDPIKGRAFSWLAATFAVGCLALIGITLAVFLPILGSMRLASIVEADLRRLEQIGLAMRSYLADHDDRFPPNMAAPDKVALQPYLGRTNPFDADDGEAGPFAGNPTLAGLPLASVERPADTFLFFRARAYPDRQRAVGMVDGSSRLVKEDAFQSALVSGWQVAPSPAR
ncbi:MAG: hypothetical protein KF884_00820 [Fimbriimonadaceae bacterium]|nr:hypothetical protein [Fimbriimonadaceae bacterium]QYK58638.1 MAG: hypothetical protein KF884_00820 [Fimbriimonadaceae bacterium]